MPSRAMKPTEAGTDRYSPVNHSPMMPPTSAKGTLLSTSRAWRTGAKGGEQDHEDEAQRQRHHQCQAAARCWFSNCPPQAMR